MSAVQRLQNGAQPPYRVLLQQNSAALPLQFSLACRIPESTPRNEDAERSSGMHAEHRYRLASLSSWFQGNLPDSRLGILGLRLPAGLGAGIYFWYAQTLKQAKKHPGTRPPRSRYRGAGC